jgi:branched-chain amino acid transport system permease protein
MSALLARWRETYAPVGRFLSRHQSISVLVGMTVVALVLPLIARMPPFNSFLPYSSWLNTFTLAGVYVLLALGLNIVVGLSGLLDLGYAAFFALGSYMYAFGASGFYGNHIPFWIMLVIGLAVAAVFGILLGAPTLRLRGDYLAIVTLGFGEIVPIVFKNGDMFTGGVNGISGLDPPTFLDYRFRTTEIEPFYIVMIGLIAFALIFIYRLQDSRLGRAWMAIREDELAAASSGINTVSTKLLAFALGASTAGLAGAFSASKLTFVGPDQFNFTVSFTVLAMVVLGGMGNNWGVAAGAFVLYLINSVFLRLLNQFFDAVQVPILTNIDFIQYQFLLYGIALVLMMLLRPQGFFASRRRARELKTSGEGSMGSASGDDAAPVIA